MEEYKKIRKENLDDYMKSASAKRELAVSLLPQGPPLDGEGGSTQIGGTPFDAEETEAFLGIKPAADGPAFDRTLAKFRELGLTAGFPLYRRNLKHLLRA